MGNKKINMLLEAIWDKAVVPAGRPRKRGLLIELTGRTKQSKKKESQGVNLALVIDRSGSMGTHNMEAAKEAATGVVESLGENDVLSVVDFDTEISVLAKGLIMTASGKRKAKSKIRKLRARGGTALAAGWFEGAQCVAGVIDHSDFNTGHVVLLSDGHANSGMMDPRLLMEHATELASRGITTSTVGIGDNYSPLQLDALAEGGRGRLHDAEGGHEIVEVIMGELGEARDVAATDVAVTIRWPDSVNAELLSRYESDNRPSSITVYLGQLISGMSRAVPLYFDVPGLPVGEVVDVEIVVEGRKPKSGKAIEAIVLSTRLTALPPEQSRAVERDRYVAERIARIWESTVGFDAMRINETGDYLGAQNVVTGAFDELVAFSADTGAAHEVVHNLRVAERKVGRAWDGRSKRESMIAAKKFSKGERDHRSDPRGKWSDHI